MDELREGMGDVGFVQVVVCWSCAEVEDVVERSELSYDWVVRGAEGGGYADLPFSLTHQDLWWLPPCRIGCR